MVVAHVEDGGFDREDLEKIEGETFDTKHDAEMALRRANPLAEYNIMFVPLYEFCTDWNDTDNDGNYIEENYAPHETFISYCTIKFW